jgi:electron transport complex protein RnfB
MTKQEQLSTVAFINETACIGCAKCIKVCPVDAILGSQGKMHTVIASECIGCKLCLPPCPVDCIELLTIVEPSLSDMQRSSHIKRRHHARQQRLARQEMVASSLAAKRDYINKAILRTKKAALKAEK